MAAPAAIYTHLLRRPLTWPDHIYTKKTRGGIGNIRGPPLFYSTSTLSLMLRNGGAYKIAQDDSRHPPQHKHINHLSILSVFYIVFYPPLLLLFPPSGFISSSYLSGAESHLRIRIWRRTHGFNHLASSVMFGSVAKLFAVRRCPVMDSAWHHDVWFDWENRF